MVPGPRRGLDKAANRSSHEDEEFILMPSGAIEMHTEFHQPVTAAWRTCS